MSEAFFRIPTADLDLDLTGSATASQLTTVRATPPLAYSNSAAGVWTALLPIRRASPTGASWSRRRGPNSIRNNSMTGAVAGTPGTAPTNWAAWAATVSLTVQLVGVGTTNGIDYIDYRLSGTASGAGNPVQFFGGITDVAASPSQAWTQSVFLAMVGGSQSNIGSIQINAYEYNGASGFLRNDAGAVAVTSSLTRFSRTWTTGVSTAFVRPSIFIQVIGAGAVDITIRIGWPQLELGAFVTSPIRTTTVAVTRAADAVTIASVAWFNQTTGTMFAEGSAHSTAIGTTAVFQIDSGAATDRHLLGIDGAGDNLVGATITGGAQQSNMLIVATANNKLAMAYAANDEAFSGNGGTVQTDAVVTLPATLTTARLGANTTGFWSGYIRRVSYWPTRLSNAHLKAMTT